MPELTKEELLAELASDVYWGDTYEAVVRRAYEVLDQLPEQQSISTTELANLMLPPAGLTEEQLKLRARMFRILQSVAVHRMGNACFKGDARLNAYGRWQTPWRWHKPWPPVPRCPCCGSLLRRRVTPPLEQHPA